MCWDTPGDSGHSAPAPPDRMLEQGQTLSVVLDLCLARKQDRNESLQPEQHQHPTYLAPGTSTPLTATNCSCC